MAISVYTYPYKRRDFQKLFMRIDIVDNIVDPPSDGFNEGKAKDNTESSIYLPLPLGLLRENHVLEYQGEELGILGTLVTQNYNAVKNAFSGLTGEADETGVDRGVFGDLIAGGEKIGDMAIDSFKTIVDKTLMESSKFGIPIMLQANGLARRANYALLFQGIDQPRDFTLEWTFFPKTYDDAVSIETIIKVIQKAAMPEIKNKSLFDNVVEATQNVIEDRNYLVDVHAKETIEPTGLFSSTFIIPKKINIKLFERVKRWNDLGNIDENYIEEITHLMNFPHEIVMSNIIVEHAEGENTLPPFIKYDNGGTTEYFHTVYKLRITMSDLQVTTRDHINLNY